MTTPIGFAPQRPRVSLQTNPNQANRSAIAGMMGSPQGGFGFPPSAHNSFGFAGGPFGSGQMPSRSPMFGADQMPIPPSLTPGVGTSSPAMTNWRPPQYGPSAPPTAGFAPPIQPIQGSPAAPTRQPMPVSPTQNPYLRPVTR